MTSDGQDRLGRKMDRIEIVQRAKKAGLPEVIAIRVADVVTGTGLADASWNEVLGELIAHFQDGLASGKTAEQLLAAFGDGREAAREIGAAKRVVTPETLGGTGRDGILFRVGRDLRYGVRRLLSRPAYAGIAILSLALGIGANSAMFTLVNDLILRKPTMDRPEELVNIYQSTHEFGFNAFSQPDYDDLVRGTTAFAGIASSKMELTPYESGERPIRLATEMVSANYFEVFGLHARLGRLIAPADAPAPGQGAVVVLSERCWRRVFGADRSIVGRAIRLNGASYQVLGVLPADYPGMLRAIPTDLYVPVMIVDQFQHAGRVSILQDRGTVGTFVVGRLKPGATVEQARVELARVARDHQERKVHGWQADASITVLPNASVIIYPPVDKILVPVAAMLMLVVALVLVIACANLAGFLLARAVDRRKEIAVRLALGATRRILVGQLLTETVLLAMLGGAAGVMLGRLALRAVLSSDVPLPLPIDLVLHLDWRVIGFSVAVSMVAGIFFGLIPALQATKMELASVIRDESTGGGRGKVSLRHLLVSGQVAVSMVLLVLAGLFVRSLDAARRVDPGFGDRPAWLVWLGFPNDRANEGSRVAFGRMIAAIAAVPGVDQVGISSNIHLNWLGTQEHEISVPGIEPPAGRTTHLIDRAAIDTGFIGAARLRLVAGRNFTSQDLLLDSTRRVVIVNEAFAARFFPGRSALGQRFRSSGHEVEVVGVVATARIRSLSEEPRPFIYDPADYSGGAMFLVVRTSGPADRLASQIREAIRSGDPEAFPIDSRSLQSHIATQSYPLKMGAAALMAFAVLAMVMACIGLYGAVSYAVAQRSREVGIRLSLGAGPRAVVRMLLWGGFRLVAGGAVVGILLSALIGRLLQGLLFGVSGSDPMTLVVVPAMLMGVTFLAAWVPARRAGRISPLVALKSE